MEKYFPKEKIYLTGNPIRFEIQNIEGKREKGLRYFGLNPDKKVLLVVGGSLGARSINESIKENLKLFAENEIQIIWQTGKYYYSVANKSVEEFRDKNIEAYEFINAMDLAYAASDVIVSRAGAIAVSEISTVNKPAILIPLPSAAEDHQTKNAISLVNHNAAILVKDEDANDKLGKVILDLVKDEEKQIKIKENLVGLVIKDSANKIASVILSLIKNNEL
jgi:UDP-N-acetylglucosamine--N-acetylmuramyl-(pentapeptide) pyrophosphoryl-undecaprenol N-acetylglucosamine transferase